MVHSFHGPPVARSSRCSSFRIHSRHTTSHPPDRLLPLDRRHSPTSDTQRIILIRRVVPALHALTQLPFLLPTFLDHPPRDVMAVKDVVHCQLRYARPLD